MTKRCFAIDPLTGTMSYVDYDEATDTFTLVDEIDPTNLIEWNKNPITKRPIAGATAPWSARCRCCCATS